MKRGTGKAVSRQLLAACAGLILLGPVLAFYALFDVQQFWKDMDEGSRHGGAFAIIILAGPVFAYVFSLRFLATSAEEDSND